MTTAKKHIISDEQAMRATAQRNDAFLAQMAQSSTPIPEYITTEQRKQLLESQRNEVRCEELRAETVVMADWLRARSASPDACRMCGGYGFVMRPASRKPDLSGLTMSGPYTGQCLTHCDRCQGSGTNQ